MQSSQKTLSVFKLVMMAVVAIDSIKNLPANAQYGTSLLFFYVIAILAFFLPSALVSAELATSLPHTGGVYVWIREAFGKYPAFMAVWMQWIVQVTWYPTILSFVAVTLVYLFAPDLASNKVYILGIVLSLYWIAIFFVIQGITLSSKISTFCAIVGVIVPMVFIISLGGYWILSGKNVQINFSWHENSSHLFTKDNFRLFITLLYSLMGMEMIAVHAGDVRDPKKDYPKALIISAIIIIATVIPASLAIAIVVPANQIGLTTGVNDAFITLLNAFNLQWLKPVVIISIAVGSFGIFYNWLLTSSRCLLIAADDNNFPDLLCKTNQHHMPVQQLFMQGIIFTLLCGVFILMPSINSAYWLLTASYAQLALIFYLFLFGAALALRYKHPNIERPFRVGKHPAILWAICLLAISICAISIFFGFLPPQEVDGKHVLYYELYLISLMVGSCALGGVIYKYSKDTRFTQNPAMAKVF